MCIILYIFPLFCVVSTGPLPLCMLLHICKVNAYFQTLAKWLQKGSSASVQTIQMVLYVFLYKSVCYLSQY